MYHCVRLWPSKRRLKRVKMLSFVLTESLEEGAERSDVLCVKRCNVLKIVTSCQTFAQGSDIPFKGVWDLWSHRSHRSLGSVLGKYQAF